VLASRWVRLAWPEVTERSSDVPARVVSAVSLELRARRRRRVAARVAAAAFGSLAAAAAGIVAWSWVEHREPVALRTGSSPPAGAQAHAFGPTDEALWVRLAATSPEREVVPGDTFRAASSGGTAEGVRLASTDGTELVVEPGGMLQVVEAGATKRFTLLRGAVRVRVRKLRSEERFVIDTPEAEVAVHGTRFRVTRAEAVPGTPTGTDPSRCAGGGASTMVSVSEGVVSVAGAGSEVRLLPGETWSSPCPTSAARTSWDGDSAVASAAPASASAGTRPRPDRERRRWLPRRHRDAAPPSPSPSQLAAQNDLFVAAARARRQGHPSQALELFERFVETYPDSSLLESAQVQRMRLLRTSGTPGAAAQAATRYLGEFPDGFARTEAEQVLGIAGPSAPAPSAVSPNRDR
jgi:ferric-dicitrate binding protein FerR (iron transport regulator)